MSEICFFPSDSSDDHDYWSIHFYCVWLELDRCEMMGVHGNESHSAIVWFESLSRGGRYSTDVENEDLVIRIYRLCTDIARLRYYRDWSPRVEFFDFEQISHCDFGTYEKGEVFRVDLLPCH